MKPFKIKSKLKSSVGVCVLTAAISLPITGFSQEQDPSIDLWMGEVIVTAQKREQDLSDVPMALTALQGPFLNDSGATNAYDALQFVPGLTGINPSEELSQITVRGVSTNDFGVGSDAAVGVFLDDVFLGRYGNTATTFIDLEQVEVARGPQGALFGRATPAGAILMVTKKPRDYFDAEASIEVGERG
jgi:iron complex outermembrane receptor protein